MGIIRGFVVIVLSVLLFLAVFSSALLWILSSSLSYENVQKESSGAVKDLLSEMNVDEVLNGYYPLIQMHCQNNSEYVFKVQKYTFDIPCGVALQGKEAIIEEGVRDVVKNIYYAEYDCNFWNCFEKSEMPSFLISEKAHNYWKGKLFLALVTVLAMSVLMFLFIAKKTSLPITLGISGAVTALAFLKIESVFSLFPEILSKFLNIFFSQSYAIAIKFLITGIILIIAGIILKVLKIGVKIEGIVEKIKEESKKDKQSTKDKKQKKK